MASLLIDRLGNCSFFRPVHLESVRNKTGIASESSSPLSQGHGDPFVGYKFTSAGVVLLLLYRCPPAIFRRVVAIVVDAVNRVIGGRFFAHIRKKVRKGIYPFITDSNTPASVIMKTFVIFVATAVFHAHPNRVKMMISKAMSRNYFSKLFFGQATTRKNLFCFEVTGASNRFTATSTNTEPTDFTVLVSGNRRNSDKSAEYFTGNVYSVTVGRYNFISHVILLVNRVVRWRSVSAGRTPIIAWESV